MSPTMLICDALVSVEGLAPCLPAAAREAHRRAVLSLAEVLDITDAVENDFSHLFPEGGEG